ncbi:NADH:ubiquinone oxidoreductase subunit NDUFA12 [Alkalicaulis satelles]|uniref:NADH:ubiquinone oxidoreductase subunit NDUFA12 n=1 Tax=Alkalicaulis satelles TaxID=2609175 RepID=A0A5M6ZAK9_9PROT|nr:NADH:ubiquinone oxidoreductase subunit NDUFA12 [Alkalicaulis satelles]KAA5801732.1 NADH:ubiquinone oxidoreductase subunit NDUFA12 [Alkalicaulis satelles]
MLGLLSKIFTWWNGASAGAAWTIWRSGKLVGEDQFGNRYYTERKGATGADDKPRRWVVYNGYADASRVPSDWHGWLHHTFEAPPTEAPLPRREWELDHAPNLTGTLNAYRPAGSLAFGGERRRQATPADYEPWEPGR